MFVYYVGEVELEEAVISSKQYLTILLQSTIKQHTVHGAIASK